MAGASAALLGKCSGSPALRCIRARFCTRSDVLGDGRTCAGARGLRPHLSVAVTGASCFDTRLRFPQVGRDLDLSKVAAPFAFPPAHEGSHFSLVAVCPLMTATLVGDKWPFTPPHLSITCLGDTLCTF